MFRVFLARCLLALMIASAPLWCWARARGATASDAVAGGEPRSAVELNNAGVTAAQAGRFEEGVALLRRALTLDSSDARARKNLSGVLLDWARALERRGQVAEAVAALREAIQHDPNNGQALVRLGDLLYLKRSDIAAALTLWKQAYGKVPTPIWQAVANRIAQAERDQLIERGFLAQRTAHFALRFQESSAIDVAALERVLEASYARLLHALGRGPSTVTVMIYAGQDLQRVSQQRDWVIGLYDGRIRLRLDDLVQPYLPDVVSHELAHAFLHHAYGDRLPLWVHEGYAQLQERPRHLQEEAARIEEGLKSRSLWIPLRWLDRHFEQPSSADDITRAYLEARLVVSELMKRHGSDRFIVFLEQLAAGASVEHASEQAFAPSTWSRADRGIFD